MSLSLDAVNGLNGVKPAQTQNDAASADRFLKLLVAQMKNQDPLNPMDNAQVTTQMAQISTVDGIAKLNATVQGLNTQFVQMQSLQGASLVGRHVTVPGDHLAVTGGVGQGAFELAGPVDRVRVEILNASGAVIETLDLGAQDGGRHGFDWDIGAHPEGADYRFRVSATSGAAQVGAQPLMLDRVQSVSVGGNSLDLQLERSGLKPYSSIIAFN